MKKIRTLILLVLMNTVSFAQQQFEEVNHGEGLITANHSFANEISVNNAYAFHTNFNNKNEFIEEEQLIPAAFKARYKSSSDYRTTVEFGYNMASGDYGIDRLDFNVIEHYQLNQHFSAGAGTGLRYYKDEDAMLVPIFMDIRAIIGKKTFSQYRKPYSPIKNTLSPYISIGFGYSFDATNGFAAVGLMFKPTIGISSKISDNSSLNIGFGYETQRMQFFYEDEFSASSGAVNFNIGFSF